MKNQNNDLESIITFELGDRIVILKIQDYDEIDTDEITKIQYHNIIGELLTCSTILNRLGNLVAQVDEALSEGKLDFDIFYAQKYEDFMKELSHAYTNTRGRDVVDKPTGTEVEQKIIRTPEYKVKRRNVIRLQKQRDIINSLYWSVKSKDDKLNKLTDKIRPEEFEKEILEGEINGILIRVKNKAIK